MRDCVFCRIVRKEASALIVHETDTVICFLPIEVEVYGHTLVVPKAHHVDLYDTPAALLHDVITAAQQLTVAYRERIGATGMNLLHASGRDAQQSVFHFHVHLLPRFPDDGLNTWPSLPAIRADREELLRTLRAE